MATALKKKQPSQRTVVLLPESARKRLHKLAATENVSSGEIIRRSLDSYVSLEARVRKEEEERLIEMTLDMLNEALQDANASMERTCQKLDELHLEMSKREIPDDSNGEVLQHSQTNHPRNRHHRSA